MSSATQYRVRRSFRDVEREHFQARANGNKDSTELERLILSWRGIQDLDPADFRSFFTIAGYHGEPFRGGGWGSTSWWGGYCNHGNILFPTWHRAYLHRLEEAMRSIPGCEDVTLPFWDEADDLTWNSGVPDTFSLRLFTLADGKQIDNPLFSYKFQKGIFDNIPNDSSVSGADYSKPTGYETVRYPLSGLVGPDDIKKTTKHNAKYPHDNENFEYLNGNVKAWLGPSVEIKDKPKWTGILEKYRRCLDAPNYTVFSNGTSATQWNEDNFEVRGWLPEEAKVPEASKAMVPLESPHNSMHLAVGGFDIHRIKAYESVLHGANGDMGENDTASFDPIFYFHHCFVDRCFWLWQQKHGQTQEIEMDPRFAQYPGTNSIDGQNPTPGRAGNVWLTLDTPLEPFRKDITSSKGEFMTSMDVVDIESQLGYTYGPGSLTGKDALVPKDLFNDEAPLTTPAKATPIIRASGISRGSHAGSMVVTAWATVNGEKHLVGVESVLSRWHVEGCANCQNHLGVTTFMTLHGLKGEDLTDDNVEVKLHTREQPEGFQDKTKVRVHVGHSAP